MRCLESAANNEQSTQNTSKEPNEPLSEDDISSESNDEELEGTALIDHLFNLPLYKEKQNPIKLANSINNTKEPTNHFKSILEALLQGLVVRYSKKSRKWTIFRIAEATISIVLFSDLSYM